MAHTPAVRSELTPTKGVLLGICTYEATALASGRVPTITNLMWRLDPVPRALILVGVAVWAVDHFFRVPAPTGLAVTPGRVVAGRGQLP